MNEYLDLLSSLRESADYDFEMDISERNARLALEHAREFLTATKKYFNLN